MATKTFKIGECCIGGIITVEITGKVIKVINKEWDNSAGYTRKSNQSNATVLSTVNFNTDRNTDNDLFMYLTDLTTPYYSDQIIEWIKTKVQLGENNIW